MLPPTTFLSACCAVLLKFVKMFFLRENLMQPLQMRFIVTKESIANVYSMIKSESAEQRIYIIPANLLLLARGTRNNFVKTSNRNLPEIIQNVRIFTLCPNCRCW